MSSTVNTNNTASSGTGAGSSNTTTAQNALNSNYQDFLKLLTTQLQNQDPTAPADTNQLTQEIAMLSQVEQQINSNTYLQQLVSLYGSTQVNNAVGYIGKQIDATGNQTELKSGSATMVYTLPSAATSATVTISDSSGKVVFSGTGTTSVGRNQVIWDGTSSDANSTAQPNGTYTFTVTAKDASGKDITPTTYTTGVVQAVDTQSGTTTLSLGGGISVPYSNVQSIYAAGTNPGA